MKGRAATLTSCFFAASSSGTPLVQAKIGAPPSQMTLCMVVNPSSGMIVVFEPVRRQLGAAELALGDGVALAGAHMGAGEVVVDQAGRARCVAELDRVP